MTTASDASPWLRRGGIAAAIVGVPLFIAAFDNTALWSRVASLTSQDDHQLAIMSSLFVIATVPLIALLALVPTRLLLKLVASALLIVSAVSGYFMSAFGTVIDTTMIRNVAETSLHESGPLLTAGFFWHLLVFGFVPSIALAVVPLTKRSLRRGAVERLGFLAFASVGFAGAAYLSYGPLSFFAHQHRELRLMLNPTYPIYSYLGYLFRSNDVVPAQRVPLDATVTGATGRARKTLIVLVMGETARADHFEYNGYDRATDPYTRSYGLVSYSDVSACGTSTADSVPCLFAKFGRKEFTHEASARNESLFGTLERLGVNVLWRDNSTGCKDVCDADHFEQYVTATDSDFCDSTGCFDEILLENLDAEVRDTARDQFIVLHQRGSHGPAYHTDVPADKKAFYPECNQAILRNCTADEIENAYDNTILYTDYFLSRLIESLLALTDEYDVAMLYVSDHGESLGENGLYLHGFPYYLAPKEQIKVPMIFWASRSFLASSGLDPVCLQSTASQPVSHDYVFHTLLPLFEVRSPEYREDLDLFAACRGDRLEPVRVSRVAD